MMNDVKITWPGHYSNKQLVFKTRLNSIYLFSSFSIIKGDLLSIDNLFLDDLYSIFNYKILEIRNDLASHVKQTDEIKLKNDICLKYKMSTIKEDLLN